MLEFDLICLPDRGWCFEWVAWRKDIRSSTLTNRGTWLRCMRDSQWSRVYRDSFLCCQACSQSSIKARIDVNLDGRSSCQRRHCIHSMLGLCIPSRLHCMLDTGSSKHRQGCLRRILRNRCLSGRTSHMCPTRLRTSTAWDTPSTTSGQPRRRSRRLGPCKSRRLRQRLSLEMDTLQCRIYCIRSSLSCTKCNPWRDPMCIDYISDCTPSTTRRHPNSYRSGRIQPCMTSTCRAQCTSHSSPRIHRMSSLKRSRNTRRCIPWCMSNYPADSSLIK